MDPIRTATSGASTSVAVTGLVFGILGTVIALAVFVRGELRWRYDRKEIRFRVLTLFHANLEGLAGTPFELDVVVINEGEKRALDCKVVWTMYDPALGVRRREDSPMGSLVVGDPQEPPRARIELIRGPQQRNPEHFELWWKTKPGGRWMIRRYPINVAVHEAPGFRRSGYQIRERVARAVRGSMTATQVPY